MEEGGIAFDTNAPIYTIYADDAPYLTVHLVPTASYVRLGLLTITDWEVARAILHSPNVPASESAKVDEGLAFDVSVPETAGVTVNGKQLATTGTATASAPMPGFEYASQFVPVPEAATYRVSGLVSEPEVAASNADGTPIALNRTENGFAAATLATPNREASQLPIDPLTVAETWSLLMTNDLGGGVDQVTQYLIPGSELYNQATEFVNSIDITFVWSHSFTGFSNESVTNCIMYNDSLFSCDVRLNKNMVLSSGEERTDEFANTMIFAYVDNNSVSTPGWYLVNMQAITSAGEAGVAAGAAGATTVSTTSGATNSATGTAAQTNATNETDATSGVTTGATTGTGTTAGTTTGATATNGTAAGTATGTGATTNGTGATAGTTTTNGTGATAGTTTGTTTNGTGTTAGTTTTNGTTADGTGTTTDTEDYDEYGYGYDETDYI